MTNIITDDQIVVGSMERYAKTNRFRYGAPKICKFLNENTFFFLRSGGETDTCYNMFKGVFSLDGNEATDDELLYTPSDLLGDANESLSEEEKALRERMRLTTTGFSNYHLIPNSEKILIPISGRVFVVPMVRDVSKIVEITGAAGGFNFKVAPNGKFIVFTRNEKLYSLDLSAPSSEARLISPSLPQTLPNSHVVYGEAEFCAQEEMSRFSGFWISPCSTMIAYQSYDDGEVDSIYIADPSKPNQAPTRRRYPFAGTSNPSVSFFVCLVASPEERIEIPLQTLDSSSFRFEYLNTVVWSGRNSASTTSDNETDLLLLIQNREQTLSHILRASFTRSSSISLHSLQPIYQISDAAWLNIDQTVPAPIRNGSQFLFSDESSGSYQLYLHDTVTGKRVGEITPANLHYRAFLGFDEVSQTVFVTGGPNPTENSLFALPLSSSTSSASSAPTPYLVTKGRGVHTISAFCAQAGVSGGSTVRFLDAFDSIEGDSSFILREMHLSTTPISTPDITLPAPTAFSKHADVFHMHPSVARIVGQIGNNAALASVANFALLSLPLSEGRVAHGALILPSLTYLKNRPEGKIPLVVCVYGGPGFRVVSAAPRMFAFPQILADNGYAVLSVDGRGTPDRGREWERAIKHDFITVPMGDQVDGVKSLQTKDFKVEYCSSDENLFSAENVRSLVDFTRVGVYGWSFGGYFSAMASMLRPDVFKACVSGAPVTDWKLYDTHYTERFLGVPPKDEEAYERSCVMPHVEKMNSDLLLIHGTADDNVVFGHATRLSDALFRANKNHEFLPLTDFTHMVADPAVVVSLYSKIISFFHNSLRK